MAVDMAVDTAVDTTVDMAVDMVVDRIADKAVADSQFIVLVVKQFDSCLQWSSGLESDL